MCYCQIEDECKVWYEPTDVKKVCKIFESNKQWSKVLQFVSPNVKELLAMAQYFSIKISDTPLKNIEIDEIKEISKLLVEYIPIVFTTMGPDGLLVTRRATSNNLLYDFNAIISNKNINYLSYDNIEIRHYPVLLKIDENSDKKFSASGCGDCLVAGIIVGMLKGLDESSCVSLGLKAAAVSFQSLETVPQTLQDLII